MASLRFATLGDLYEAFPTAADDIGEAPADAQPLAFLQALAAAGSWDKAVSLCAYLLPRREAVWWGCQSLRRMIPLAPEEEDGLAWAEAWVREPEEGRRRAALRYGGEADSRLPSSWMALAAGWSGGSIVPPEVGVVPAAPHQTARAVRAGLMIAMVRIASENLPAVMTPCLAEGAALAGGERR
ncbi:MAG TPA: hypothetical protein VHD15_08500 [Hyphomicrobiales bacterium]|nr:hypothetical protein [Hyphomicrobiales bacterium]